MPAIHTDHCLVCSFVPREGYGVYQVCGPCRGRIRTDLFAMPGLYADLEYAMMPGGSKGPRISGSKEKPMPGGAALVLRGPSPPADSVTDSGGDQVGPVPIVGILDSWERDWRETFGHQAPVFRGTTEQAITQSIRYLIKHLDLACDEHSAIDEFVDELRQLRLRCRAALGDLDKPEHNPDIPCPKCDHKALYRPSGSDTVHCGVCGNVGTRDDYQRWTRFLAEAAKEAS